jgi:hypothetical protein
MEARVLYLNLLLQLSATPHFLSIGRIFMRVAGYAILIVRFRGVCDHELSLFADYGILVLVEHCLGARLMISSY